MAKIESGVVGMAEITGGGRTMPDNMGPETPSFWTAVIAGGAMAFLFMLFIAGKR